jgi:hypothetical protein
MVFSFFAFLVVLLLLVVVVLIGPWWLWYLFSNRPSIPVDHVQIVQDNCDDGKFLPIMKHRASDQ